MSLSSSLKIVQRLSIVFFKLMLYMLKHSPNSADYNKPLMHTAGFINGMNLCHYIIRELYISSYNGMGV